GIQYENFMAVANKMRTDYDFFHTSDASILPRGDLTVKGPLLRLFKPFDELFVDSQDFDDDAIKKFIEVSGFPTVVTFDADPTNHKFIERYYSTPSAKAMLFLRFSDDRVETFKSQMHEAARQLSGNNISFLIGDVSTADRAFEYFGLKESDVPLLLVLASTGKYLNPTMEPDQLIPWMKQYIYGNLTPYVKSEPIPKVNDQPVKVVVADNIDEIVFNSGKNVLLEFYAPWCGHCRKLAPILEEVAVSLQDDEDVVIAKMVVHFSVDYSKKIATDSGHTSVVEHLLRHYKRLRPLVLQDGTANDIPTDFAVEGYPALYFYSSSGGDLLTYDGQRTAKELISFIKKNRGAKAAAVEVTQTDAVEEEVTSSTPSGSIQDEL
uniref:Thioredoxin domain-containing protein n=1 Tax=Aegilops tauschii subsp. strangulata TaxID=200361 RepID=A0A453C0R9_AEGTS